MNMLVGSRIRLRPIERSEIPLLAGWFNDHEITQWIQAVYPMTLGEEERWYDQMLQRPPELHPLMIDISTPDGWLPIGDCGFNQLSWVNRSAEVGIVIGEKRFWGQGYGRDALRLLLRFGFNTLNLNRISLLVHADNIRGIRSYEKAGFVHEGRERQGVYKNGEYKDVLIMSVLRSEWEDGKI